MSDDSQIGPVPLPDNTEGQEKQNPLDSAASAAGAAEQAALRGKIGSGAATGAGIARDVAEGTSAAAQGRVGDATDAAVRATATGAATSFGGTAGGDATRKALNTGGGRAATKSIKWIALAAVAALLLPVILVGAVISSVLSTFNTNSAANACLAGNAQLAYNGGSGGIWAMQFLHDQGLRGEPLRVMWSIVMRESGGDPSKRTPTTGTYPNGTYDAGLYQTNSSNSSTLASYGLTMEDAFDPAVAFNFWMRRASPGNKLMSSLNMWGLNSWDNPTLNARNYSNWSPEQQQNWIVIPFNEKMAMFDDAARQAGIQVGTTSAASVTLPPLGNSASVTLTVTGGQGDVSIPVADPSASPQPSTFGPGNPAPGDSAIPEDQKTVSGWEALKRNDPRLVTYPVAGRNITTHRDYQQLFTDFLNAWNDDPVLGRGRLNIDTGVGPVDSYEYRKARVTTNRWSDHAGYAVDIRYDLLPPFVGQQMTDRETAAVRRLLERFPQLGWGGDYSEEYLDEMHFYVAPGANVQPSANPCAAFAGAIPPTGDLQARALTWALAITGGTYNYDTLSNPDKRPPNYNCSTLTAAAYRFASGDEIQLTPNSQFQWTDTRNIVLVPFAEAQPGDIFFERTINNRGNPVGHVGLIVDVNGGDQAIWHACGASSCQSNGNIGIGYSSLDHVQMWMTVDNPARANDVAERAKYRWTTNRNEAYVGRVVQNGESASDGRATNNRVVAAAGSTVARTFRRVTVAVSR